MKLKSRCLEVTSTSWSIFDKKNYPSDKFYLDSYNRCSFSFSIGFSHHQYIGEPIGIINFSNKASYEELVDLFVDDLLPFKSKRSFLLSHRPNFWINVQLMVIISRGMPDISVADQANISIFILNRFISCYRSGSSNYDLIWIVFSESLSFNGIEISCSTGSSLSSFFIWSNLSMDKESLN